MTFTREQKQAAYKKLPEEVQTFIGSSETIELISEALRGIGLDEEQENLADSEILYAMLGLQTLDVAVFNIGTISGKKSESLAQFKESLQKNIFDKYPQTGAVKAPQENSKPNVQETKRAVIEELSQRVERARQMGSAMPVKTPEMPIEIHPMVEAGEEVHDAEPATESPKPEFKPTPAPTPKPQSRFSGYPDGQDPYREPLS